MREKQGCLNNRVVLEETFEQTAKGSEGVMLRSRENVSSKGNS